MCLRLPISLPKNQPLRRGRDPKTEKMRAATKLTGPRKDKLMRQQKLQMKAMNREEKERRGGGGGGGGT